MFWLWKFDLNCAKWNPWSSGRGFKLLECLSMAVSMHSWCGEVRVNVLKIQKQQDLNLVERGGFSLVGCSLGFDYTEFCGQGAPGARAEDFVPVFMKGFDDLMAFDSVMFVRSWRQRRIVEMFWFWKFDLNSMQGNPWSSDRASS